MAGQLVRKSLVVMSGTFILFLEVGIMKGFSFLLPAMQEYFSSALWIIGSSTALAMGLGHVLGEWSTIQINTVRYVVVINRRVSAGPGPGSSMKPRVRVQSCGSGSRFKSNLSSIYSGVWQLHPLFFGATGLIRE